MARQMKDSGFEWIGEIPANWEVRKVKHYYNIQTGFTPDTKNELFYDDVNGYDWVNISDIDDGKTVLETKKKVSRHYIDLFNPSLIPEGSLLYSFKLSVGQTAFAGKALYSNEAIASFIPSVNVNLRYLRYSSMFIIENAQTNIYSAKILNQDLIKNAYIVFPPLTEQKIIADYLDSQCAKIDTVIAKTKAAIEEYKKLKQSIITEAVTKGIHRDRPMKDSGIEWIGDIPADWNISRLKYVSDFDPSTDKRGLDEECIITYTPMDCIKNGWFINQTVPLGSVSPSLTTYQNGDIVMAKVTPCFENGNIAIMENLSSGYGLGSSELFVFRARNIETKYLFYWLRNDNFIQSACSTMTGTGGLKRVSPTFVKNCYLHLPPVEEQREIADYLDKKCAEIDTLIAKKTALLEEMESYKKSVIYEYVTGKKEVL